MVHQRLRRVDGFARAIMALADGFERGFYRAQIGHLAFHRGAGLQHLSSHFFLIFARLLAAQIPLLLLAQAVLGVQLVVFGSNFGLLF